MTRKFNTYVDDQLREIRRDNRREYLLRCELSLTFDTLAYKREIERASRRNTRRQRKLRLARNNALATS